MKVSKVRETILFWSYKFNSKRGISFDMKANKNKTGLIFDNIFLTLYMIRHILNS